MRKTGGALNLAFTLISQKFSTQELFLLSPGFPSKKQACLKVVREDKGKNSWDSPRGMVP